MVSLPVAAVLILIFGPLPYFVIELLKKRRKEREEDEYYVSLDIKIEKRIWSNLKEKTGIENGEELVRYCMAAALLQRPEEMTKDEVWQGLKKVTGIRSDKLLMEYCVNIAARITRHIMGGKKVFIGNDLGTDLEEREDFGQILNSYVYRDAVTSA